MDQFINFFSLRLAPTLMVWGLSLLIGNTVRAATAFSLPVEGMKNSGYILKEPQSVKLAWMCAAFRDLDQAPAQNFEDEIAIIQNSHHQFIFQIPPDLGVDAPHVWLLAGELARAGIHELAGGLYVLASTDGLELAEKLRHELAKRNITVAKVSELDKLPARAPDAPADLVIAHVALSGWASSFRKVLGQNEMSSTVVAHTLRAAFERRHVPIPKEPLTFQFLNDCVHSVVADFKTAPEFLTLIPAVASDSGARRQIASQSDDLYFILSVTMEKRALQTTLLVSDVKPKTRKKFEAEFPHVSGRQILNFFN